MQITVNEMKQFLKIQTDDEDIMLKAMVDGAISYCESYLNRPIVEANMTDETRWKVPDSIMIAIYLLVGTWYENRSSVAIGTVSKEIEFTTKDILQPHRFRGV